MLAFAVNIGFLFHELPYLRRFAAAREAGFDSVEFAWPSVDIDAVCAAVKASGLRVALLNMHAGDLDAGDRGYANDPARQRSWRVAFEDAMRVADRVGCPAVNVLAGNQLDSLTLGEQLACLEENLAWGLDLARSADRMLLIEVLNAAETPRYLFTDLRPALELIERVGDPRFRLQFDAYHLAHGERDVAALFRRVAGKVGHVQIADYPGRHEPGTGQTDFAAFFAAVDASGYPGAIGLEYVPRGDTPSGLAWLPEHLRRVADAAQVTQTLWPRG